jgi:hypothetical protein
MINSLTLLVGYFCYIYTVNIILIIFTFLFLFLLDYFDKLLELASELIRAGKAYVDDTPVEKMREERTNGNNNKIL